MNNLQKIRESCIAANPGAYEFGVPRPIRLADVLLAIENAQPQYPIVVDQNGWFAGTYRGSIYSISDPKFKWTEHVQWNLKDDNLEHQSGETINFIAGLL